MSWSVGACNEAIASLQERFQHPCMNASTSVISSPATGAGHCLDAVRFHGDTSNGDTGAEIRPLSLASSTLPTAPQFPGHARPHNPHPHLSPYSAPVAAADPIAFCMKPRAHGFSSGCLAFDLGLSPDPHGLAFSLIAASG